MDSSRRVFFFTIYSVGLYLVISFLSLFGKHPWPLFQKVNLLSDVFHSKIDSGLVEKKLIDSSNSTKHAIVIDKLPSKDFSLYQQPHFITDFSSDTVQSSLKRFMEKLHDLETSKKRKIRIAYFGDSMIEGDLLTQTFRKLLQQKFGGNGVGYVPITSQVSKFRQTVYSSYSDEWVDENFKEGNAPHLFISGHSFKTANAWVQLSDETVHDTAAVIEKSLLCGKTAGTNIRVNSKSIPLSTPDLFNRVPVENSGSNKIGISVADEKFPIYGISFESSSGIFVDNFSFRGITGIELARIDSLFLHAVSENNPYDLVVFQYGVNLLFRPNDIDFSWYADVMLPIIKRYRNCFPSADFVLVSTADRAFRYQGEYKSAIGIDSLVKTQAALAYETGAEFYNQFQTMGGKNSIVAWVNNKPMLAGKDYIHPNFRGAEILATYFFEAIMNDYKKYVQSLK